MGSHEVVHHAQLYGSPEEYVRAVTDFVAAGARRGEPVAVAVPEPKGGLLEPVLAGLPGVHFIDLADLGRNPGRLLPAVLDFAEEQARPIRVVAEPIWPGRDRDEVMEAVRHEALVCQARSDRPVQMFCLYDGRRLPRRTIAEMWHTHPDVTAFGVKVASAGYRAEDGAAIDAHWPLASLPPVEDRIEIDFEEVTPVLHVVRNLGVMAGLPPDRIEDLVLAVTELAWHSIIHGGGGGRANMWEKSPGVAVCEVADGSSWPDAHEMWLVNQLCDLVQVRSGPGGTRVRLRVGP